MEYAVFFALIGLVNFLAGFILAMWLGLGPIHWKDVWRFFLRIP